MIWVLIFGGIALAGLVMLIGYGVWLAHKAADVMSEMGVLADRGGQLMDLLAQIEIPEPELVPLPAHSHLTVEGQIAERSAT